MAEIVICEFMDEQVIAETLAHRDVHYDSKLVEYSATEQKQSINGARALIVRNRMQVTEELLDATPSLKVIGRLGVGMDNIDVQACAKRNIAVCPATGANSLSVSEYVITATLMFVRGTWFSTAAVASGVWPREQLIEGREVAGKQMGLIGYGSTSQVTATKALAMGMDVAACDPYQDKNAPCWDSVRGLEFEELLASSDVISLHIPLTDDTRHLIDTNAIAKMKTGAVLINSARGGIVDEDALVLALKDGRLSGAALDVFESEPLHAEAAARFLEVPNLLLTPHIAGITQESNIRVCRLTAQNVLRHLDD